MEDRTCERSHILADASPELIKVIYALLPGFVLSWVFYGLTAHTRPAAFERIVSALIYTAIIQAVLFPIESMLAWNDSMAASFAENAQASLFLATLLAIILGLVFAKIANDNLLHSFLNEWEWLENLPLYKRVNRRWGWIRWRWTSKTSRPTQWFSGFYDQRQWITLEFREGGRRLRGYCREWPDTPDDGHFLVEQAEWLVEDNRSIPLDTVEVVIVPATAIELVQIEKNEELLLFPNPSTPNNEELS